MASSAPESLHSRLYSLQRTCVAGAFAVSFIGAGALITLGVRSTLLLAGVGLALVTLAASPRLRKAWPTPAPTPAAPLADALA